MEFDKQVVIGWLKRIESALGMSVFILEQTYGRKFVPEEVLINFLRADTAILGSFFVSQKIYRKKVKSILDWLANPSNLEKDSQDHRIIQGALIKLLES